MWAMAKRTLPPTELFELRQALHVATLDALMASRRWEAGDLVFQGGTSLHLAHGSPRYSEDLDFLVRSSISLQALSGTMQARLDSLGWLPPDMRLTVGRAKDGRNPHAFVVTAGGPAVIGAVRVKVELWQAVDAAVTGIKASVSPVRVARGIAAGATAYLPVADREEIYADKVFALGARPYLKPRDVFDLHWLGHGAPMQVSAGDMQLRLATYPNTSPEEWVDKAFERCEVLRGAVNEVARDLMHWLPSTWPLDTAAVQPMVDVSIAALEQGIDAMREIIAENRPQKGPAP
jgi:hypothetical protein